MFFTDKIVLITGASSGIGEAMAYELAKKNAKLVLASNQPEELERVKRKCLEIGSNCEYLFLDLADAKSIQSFAEGAVRIHNGIDVLINNGGISQRAKAVDASLDLDRKIMEINYFGQIALTKAILPYMIKQRSGYITTTSSISGLFGFPLRSAYAASKHALHGFYETLRSEVYEYNIKVLIAFPGRVQTNISLHALNEKGEVHGKMDEGQAGGISAEKCAKKYLRAIKRDKKEVLIGSKELLMVYIHKYFPKLFYNLARKIDPT